MTGTVDVTGLNPDTGNQELIKTDGDGRLLVSFEGGGGQPVTIAGPLGQALMAASIPVAIASNQSAISVTTTGLAQGSTTAGQTGSLSQGAVTTAPPTYTTAQTSPLSLDTNGGLRVSEPSFISTANSSATPLGSGGVFTGTSISLLPYGSIVVSSISNVASATDGLSIQQSTDGTNWDITDVYTVSAGANINVVIPVKAAFGRVVYTNAAGAQASFRLQTTLKVQMPVASAVRPADGASIQNDFPVALSLQEFFNGTSRNLARDLVGATTAGTGVAAVAQAPNTSANGSVAPLATTVAAGSLVLKNSAGNFYYATCTSGVTPGYLMVFNATSAPADGTVTPAYVKQVAASSTIEFTPTFPIRMSTGCTIVFSTTGPYTKTISATSIFLSGNCT